VLHKVCFFAADGEIRYEDLRSGDWYLQRVID